VAWGAVEDGRSLGGRERAGRKMTSRGMYITKLDGGTVYGYMNIILVDSSGH
jgi:hypothetical protein